MYDENGPYVDAYVFMSEISPEFAQSIIHSEDYGVRFLEPTTGPFDALAVVTAKDLDELEHVVLGQLRPAGAKATETAVALEIPHPYRVVKARLKRNMAFVRVWVEPGRAREAMLAATRIRGLMGAAVVAGSFDVLLEIGADSFEELSYILLNELHGLPGVARTATSLTVIRDAEEGERSVQAEGA